MNTKVFIAGLVAAMLVTTIGGASASAMAVDTASINWETYFGTSNFNGDAFVNKTVETDVEERELKKDWEIKDGRIFKPNWANETRHSNFPEGWFAVEWITPGISG